MVLSVGSQQLFSHQAKRYREFIFISDSSLKYLARENQQLQISPNNCFLDRAEIGDLLMIKQIDAPRNIIKQLRNLRFQPNSTAEVISITEQGSVLVKLNQTLIGLGREIAQRIIVVASQEKK